MEIEKRNVRVLMLLWLAHLSKLRLVFIAAVSLLVIAANVFAQSSDVRFPTPVSSSEFTDSIAARDIGDARLTDYFYTFTGLPGDLLITVESKNLNGDIDVFSAAELRPLLKITFYAESASSQTKNIYLRKRESLILRIEARTPNDDPGTYRIRFSGSFEPISGGLVAESERPADTNRSSNKTGDRKTTRVTSAGARIEEPPEEVAAAPTPEPTPAATPSPKPEKPTAREAEKNTTASNSRGRRPPPRKTPAKSPTAAPTSDKATAPSAGNTESKIESTASSKKPAKTPKSESSTEATTNKKPGTAESKTKPESAENKPAPPRRTTGRRTPARTPAPKPQPESSARLIIEEKNGTRIEWLMSNIKSVIVEGGELVVVRHDGHVERILMTQVLRMTIGP
jgi:hypothetical protein